MTLPLPDPPVLLTRPFTFSQSSLSDYQTCARRFALRYLRRVRWPAPVAQPQVQLQHALALGQRFHQLAQLAVQGTPAETLMPADAPLDAWWAAFTAYAAPALALQPHRTAERALAAPLHVDGHDQPYQLVAKYDAVLHDGDPDGRVLIVDWKTGASRPGDAALADALQTRVYRWLMVQAGAALLNVDAIAPGQVTMMYWWAQHPQQPTVLPYSQAAYEADGAYLRALIADIAADTDWPLTPDLRACAACPYRSYCDRGVHAIGAEAFVAGVGVDGHGLWLGDDGSALLDATGDALDFDQLGEVAF